MILMTPVLAGCSSPADGDPLPREFHVETTDVDPDQERGEDEFWMVWIRGNETDGRDPAVCGRRAPDHRLDPGDERVVYASDAYSFDPDQVRVLVAVARRTSPPAVPRPSASSPTPTPATRTPSAARVP
jgi:hypothetical protein